MRGLYSKTDRTKVTQLNFMAIQYNAMAIAISESWLEESILNAELNIDGYTIYRADRSDSREI